MNLQLTEEDPPLILLSKLLSG